MIAKRNQKAFTLIETLFVVGIFVVLVLLTYPLSFDFYLRHQLDIFSEELVQNLRRAQMKSMSSEQDSNFGIYLTQKTYTLFKGSSYALREIQYDEVFEIPEALTLSGLEEVVFMKVNGNPLATGTIILSNNIGDKKIVINSLGRINLE